MVKSFLFFFTLIYATLVGSGQEPPQTRAEQSDFKSTSDYKDVIRFIDILKKSYNNLGVEYIGRSSEGRNIPLLIIGNPLPHSPEELLDDPRVVIYIQANIHAGEVEGKEASLMFARDILQNDNSTLLANVVILICPIFNPDGNDKISTLNRTDQNGPVNGVGVRYNGQFLDLNRDAMKAESPEVRGVLENVFNRWDPAVFMDCHTTNGSFHVEPVTFTWMVNPNGDKSLISYLSEKMMPEISERLRSKYKTENCFYGEFIDMMEPEKGWVLDASQPRYMSNYCGIRNRLGILNENYIYADFRTRVLGCRSLIHSLADYAASNSREIKKLIADTDRRTIARATASAVLDSFAIEYKVRPSKQKVTIQTFEADRVTDSKGNTDYKKSDRARTVTVPYFIDYYPVRSVQLPVAYLLTVNDPDVIGVLKTHGIKVEKLTEKSEIVVNRFEISALSCAPRLNQGHYTNTVIGRYIQGSLDFPAGTIVVRMAQPLANAAACLLEPESDDGLLFWNYFDRYLVPQWGTEFYPFPVYKIMKNIPLKTVPF
jgi:hypothetical protein